MSDDYDVGYKKTPVHTRFQPGQSGNPKGRAKGSRGVKTDLAAVLEARQTITINGKQITGRRQFLALQTLAGRAATGDLKAQAQLWPLVLQIFGAEDRGGERRSLSPNDQALLDELLDDIGVTEQHLAGENVAGDDTQVSNDDHDIAGPDALS